MDLDYTFFSTLNGVSTNLGAEYNSKALELYNLLNSADTISTTSKSCTDDMKQKMKAVMDEISDKLEKLRASAVKVQNVYCEVTGKSIGAVPGSDKGSGISIAIE